MIDLAPTHKIGLPLDSPIMIAAGCAGYGPPYRQLIDLAAFGAWVTNPITLRPQRGPVQPRLVETAAGIIINSGGQNPGVKKVIRTYSKLWRGFPSPVIAHLPAEAPDDLLRTARALAGTDTLVGIELGLPPDSRSGEVRGWIEAVRAGCLLPLLVKVPLGAGPELIEAVVLAGAEALVLGSPPEAAAAALGGASVTGRWYGPPLYHLTLAAVQTIARWVELPLVAAGGVHTVVEAQTLLAAGATAVQLDTLLWRDPAQAEAIARSFKEGVNLR